MVSNRTAGAVLNPDSKKNPIPQRKAEKKLI
jgi:hypothetical protein